MKLFVLAALLAMPSEPAATSCPAANERIWREAVWSMIECLDVPREVSRTRPKRYCENRALAPLIARGCSEPLARSRFWGAYKAMAPLYWPS